ncbi:MAG: PP2C family protein-serine/threonine phosphatase, partial [Burkholderiales bacterium]
LSAFQSGLDQRDRAQGELTALTQELERRVEQRTEALAAAKTEIEALNRRLAAENSRMGAELDVSRKIQRMTLPTPDELQDIPGVDVATFMESANEVGGDYYDILRHRDRLRISIGDVTGHGLESGVVMLMTQSAVRTLTTHSEGDLGKTLEVLNRTIYDNVKRMGSDKNLTLALLDYHRHAGGGRLRVGGQHESVIVVRADGDLELVDTTFLGMPLGLLEEVGEFLGETEIELSPGDTVVLYTDGITEAANAGHALYGLPRLCETIVAHRAESADAIKRAVVDDLRRHIGSQTIFDDLTLIVLKQKEKMPCAA